VGETELLVEEFAFIIERMIHGAWSKDVLMGVLASTVGIGVKGCRLQNLGEYLIFGCGRVQRSEMGDRGEQLHKVRDVGVDIISIKTKSGVWRWGEKGKVMYRGRKWGERGHP
jgi:hypothetical protein